MSCLDERLLHLVNAFSSRLKFQPIILEKSGVSHVLESLFRRNYGGTGWTSREEIDGFE
jgi:hypothetical protein